MYHFAVSVPENIFLSELWCDAFKQAKIHRIELGARVSTTPGERVVIEKNIRTLAEQGALEVSSIHLPWGWHYSSPDETERRQASKELLDFLAMYRNIPAPNCTMHGSLEPIADSDRKAVIASLRRTLADIVPAFQERKTSVNLEILPRTCIGRIPEELEEAADGFPVDTVGYCFDVNHLCGVPEKLPAYIRQLFPRLRTFHISDYDGIDECHWYPGLGVIDWAALMDVIRAIPQDVTLIFETFGFLQVPDWQKRPVFPKIVLDDAANNAFFLENAKELQERHAAFIPR